MILVLLKIEKIDLNEFHAEVIAINNNLEIFFAA